METLSQKSAEKKYPNISIRNVERMFNRINENSFIMSPDKLKKKIKESVGSKAGDKSILEIIRKTSVFKHYDEILINDSFVGKGEKKVHYSQNPRDGHYYGISYFDLEVKKPTGYIDVSDEKIVAIMYNGGKEVKNSDNIDAEKLNNIEEFTVSAENEEKESDLFESLLISKDSFNYSHNCNMAREKINQLLKMHRNRESGGTYKSKPLTLLSNHFENQDDSTHILDTEGYCTKISHGPSHQAPIPRSRCSSVSSGGQSLLPSILCSGGSGEVPFKGDPRTSNFTEKSVCKKMMIFALFNQLLAERALAPVKLRKMLQAHNNAATRDAIYQAIRMILPNTLETAKTEGKAAELGKSARILGDLEE